MPSRQRQTALLWIAFLVILVGGGWYKARENEQDWDRQVAWQDRMHRLEEESRQEFNRLGKLFQSDRTTPLSREDLERELNEGKPFDVQPSDGRLQADWKHPEYGIPVRMYFDGDQFEGWRMSGGSHADLRQNARPPRSSHSNTAEHIREVLVGISATVWLFALVISSFLRHARWPGVLLMLAASLVFGAATVLSPSYNLTVRGIFSNDDMFWAVVMYVVSIIGIAMYWPAGRPTIQFKLSHLLLVVTVAAVLLSMGRFGYFAISVFAGGSALLWLLLVLWFPQPQAECAQEHQ